MKPQSSLETDKDLQPIIEELRTTYKTIPSYTIGCMGQFYNRPCPQVLLAAHRESNADLFLFDLLTI